jgi:hypothetical protein
MEDGASRHPLSILEAMKLRRDRQGLHIFQLLWFSQRAMGLRVTSRGAILLAKVFMIALSF